MRIFSTLFFTVFIAFCSWAQKVTLNPQVSPTLFKHNDEITVVYDVTGTSLANLTDAYIWVWIPDKSVDAKYNINPANTSAETANAKFVKSTADGKTLFTKTFKPSDFFTTSIATEQKIGMLLKGNDWSNGQTTDFITTIWDGSFQIKLTAPTQEPLFVAQNDVITITAETPVVATYELFIDDVLEETQASTTTFDFDYTVTQSSGGATVRLKATAGTSTDEVTFSYIVSSSSPVASKPAGIVPGINYNSGDATRVTLCLLAPGKSSVYVRGDFSEWKTTAENIMKRDGEHFWIELDGLTSGVEYAFQYIVDEEIIIADPFTDKVLDPDDQYIPASIYPNLKTFPQEVKGEKWYFNRASVFQTGQQPYNWQVTNFQRPAQHELVVYEVLIRDFFAESERSYKNMTDTLTYLKRLGVNAIELMPIMEFNGNDSWGYNPAFMFAPDKAYGPKNELKKFIDACHAEGIAVILDIAMNHQDLPNSYLLMEYDFVANKPKANGNYFNVTATHPYSVFFDMNHESAYTKQYLDTINYYWLTEFKVDGFRFDLSKGFTQKNSGSDVNGWSAYDASRITLLKRMADKIWLHHPDAYVILEHLSANQEEKELAEYRANEGMGMMLWGKMTEEYNQNTMGFATNSDLSRVYYENRSWNYPHLVSYMESHDEERLMYKNTTFGNSAGTYSVRNLQTGLSRVEAASVLFYLVPGPKMLWQFGELGYDKSINMCGDGSISDNCRVSGKPVLWSYKDEPARDELYDHTADLIRLKKSSPLFNDGTATFSGGSTLVKQITLKNSPYVESPTDRASMNAVLVANFELTKKTVTITFPHTGTWYDYYQTGAPITVAGASINMELAPGAYKIFTDVYLEESPIMDAEGNVFTEEVSLAYPNPTTGKLLLKSSYKIVGLFDLRGVPQRFVTSGENEIDISALPAGIYMMRGQSPQGKQVIQRVIKK